MSRVRANVAKRAGMKVLLDFHYSDDWADPQKQTIPAAWAADIDDPDKLATHVYEYTRDVLARLNSRGLMPYMVQVGNEINTQMLRPAETKGDPIDWARNAKILNAGIRAVREARAADGSSPKVMLHVAQPENVEPWFAAAVAAGVRDFDYIGVSYYPKWSTPRSAAGRTRAAGRDQALRPTRSSWSRSPIHSRCRTRATRRPTCWVKTRCIAAILRACAASSAS